MAALQAPQNRLGAKSYPASSSDPIFLEILLAAQSPDAGVVAGCCDANQQPSRPDADRALSEGTNLDGVVPDLPNLDELFTDYGLELDCEVASPATAPFVLDADDMESGFLCREDEHEPEPETFEAGLLSILEDSAARALPTITAVAVAVDGAVPDLETRMSTELQVLTVPEAKKRRKKVPTPAAKQTPRWHRKRERNNHAAALNRAKEKATKVAAKQRHQRLLFRNSALRIEVQALEAELARLQAACGGAIAGTASALAFLDGLAEVEFDLLPPDLPEL